MTTIEEATRTINSALQRAVEMSRDRDALVKITGFGKRLASCLPAEMTLVGRGVADLRVRLPEKPAGSKITAFNQYFPLFKTDEGWEIKITPPAIAEHLNTISSGRKHPQLLHVADAMACEATGFAKR